MHLSSAEWALLGSTIVLGLRHGVDYDHIAAISDIAGMGRGVRRGALWSAAYALGHGAIVMLLIGLAVTLGSTVPAGVEEWMGKAVGITLVVLGLLVLRALLTSRKAEQRLPTRATLIRQAFGWLMGLVWPRRGHGHAHPHPHVHHGTGGGILSSIGVGVIHGIGAETPTQIGLVVLAAGFTDAAFAVLVGAVFVAGLLVTNVGMCVVMAGTSDVTFRRPWVYRSLMGASAVYSLVMGVIFAGGLEGHLPSIL